MIAVRDPARGRARPTFQSGQQVDARSWAVDDVHEAAPQPHPTELMQAVLPWSDIGAGYLGPWVQISQMTDTRVGIGSQSDDRC